MQSPGDKKRLEGCPSEKVLESQLSLKKKKSKGEWWTW
jgi:hypothetical protein